MSAWITDVLPADTCGSKINFLTGFDSSPDTSSIPSGSVCPIPSLLNAPKALIPSKSNESKHTVVFTPTFLNVEIPENIRKKYPDGKGGFYERKIDTENPIIYKDFINGISYINEIMKNKTE